MSQLRGSDAGGPECAGVYAACMRRLYGVHAASVRRLRGGAYMRLARRVTGACVSPGRFSFNPLLFQ